MAELTPDDPDMAKMPVLPNNPSPSILALDEDAAQVLTKELFGPNLETADVSPWNDHVSQLWQNLSRKGLHPDQRGSLLKKYFPSEAESFLKTPANNSIVKKDDFSTKNQSQVGVALCALGEAMSDFLRPNLQHSLDPAVRLVIAKFNDGAKIFAVLFYRLTLNRRAQIIPALNLLAKHTADTISADNFLFGSSFREETKKATSKGKSVQGHR